LDPKEIVRVGYDTVSNAYRDDEGRGPAGLEIRYADWLAELIPHLNPSARVLDLGCGCGLPTTKLLAERFRVTGVDFSPVQIERARRLVPAQSFCAPTSQPLISHAAASMRRCPSMPSSMSPRPSIEGCTPAFGGGSARGVCS
jgi:hypothetical protein